MPYEKNADLPERVTDNLPEHAQTIYREAFNHAWDEYVDSKKRDDKGDDRETVAHKVAWSAVKQKYHKEGERWVATKEKAAHASS